MLGFQGQCVLQRAEGFPADLRLQGSDPVPAGYRAVPGERVQLLRPGRVTVRNASSASSFWPPVPGWNQSQVLNCRPVKR